MNRRSALIFLTCALPLAACGPSHLYTGPLDAGPEGPYILASGDRLRVIVFGQDNLANIYTVDGEGRIAVPLIGPVRVAGGTTEAAARAIEARLRNGFIREPKVTVEIEVNRPFFILGEVTTPGQYPYVANMTAETAIAIAGGFAPRAQKGKVEISRNLPGQQFKGDVPTSFALKPGDTIVVKERWF